MLMNRMDSSTENGARIRDIGFILLGVAVLVFKKHYSGPFEEMMQSYAANVAVSFAVYFIARHVPVGSRNKRLLAAGLAIAAVELFEVSDGFGIMSNVYDSMDLAANAVGVALAMAVDSALASGKQGAKNA